MEVTLPFPSKVVQFVMKAMQFFHEQRQFPNVDVDHLLDILDCLLFLGFDDFLKYLAPQIAQNLDLIPVETLYKFPSFLKKLVVMSIPACCFDPDFIIQHFGYDLLEYRIQPAFYPRFTPSPFRIITQFKENDKKHLIANKLMSYNPSKFITSEFVQLNCTSVEFKNMACREMKYKARIFIKLDISNEENDDKGFSDNQNSIFLNNFDVSLLSKLQILRELILISIDFSTIVSIHYFLLKTLERLEITKNKIEPDHIRQIVDYLSTNPNLKTLTLRETKLGSIGCNVIIDGMLKGYFSHVKNLDIGSNLIGATVLSQLIKSIPHTSIESLSIDSNFFSESPDVIKKFCNINLKFASIQGVIWDSESTEYIKKALETNKVIKLWDLSAQVIHKHSDPDLTPTAAISILENSQPDIDGMFLSNHHLQHINLNCLLHLKLKSLKLVNSHLMSDSVDHILPLVDNLEFLDLSYNSIYFNAESNFLPACARSSKLKYLFLSNNQISDSNGKALFDQIREHGTKIISIRLRNCYLRHKSSTALFELLATGKGNFDELDLGGNEMFHKVQNEEGMELKKSKIEILFLGANNTNKLALRQIMKVIECPKFADFDRISINQITYIAKQLVGVVSLSLCFSRIKSTREIIQIIQDSMISELWIVNSIPQKVLDELLNEYLSIPTLMAIHVGSDVKVPMNPPIPTYIEGT